MSDDLQTAQLLTIYDISNNVFQPRYLMITESPALDSDLFFLEKDDLPASGRLVGSR